MKQQNQNTKPRYSAIAIRPEVLKLAKLACAHTGASLVDFASAAIERSASTVINKTKVVITSNA